MKTLARFYADLAPFWPLISPAHEYEQEALYAASLFRSASIPVRSVLELGSGGGHNAYYIRRSFTMTLTDLSNEMLDVSRALNPDCRHVCGDMRTLRLGEIFDAVFIHDAIEYMTTEEDLRAALATAFFHCRPGGVCVIVPDSTLETFEPGTDCGGSDADDGRGVRFMEWTWDPDPNDTWVQTEYSFVIRDSRGAITLAHDSHRTGLFAKARWMDLLHTAGFEPEHVVETTTDDRTPRSVFVAHRPAWS